MKYGLNSITLAGNVGACELKNAGTSQKLELRLAVTTRRPAAGGEWREVTTWVTVCAGWGQRAETLARMIAKGTPVLVTGRLECREYATAAGEKRTAYEVAADDVILLGSNGAGRSAEPRRGERGDAQEADPWLD